MATNRVTAVRAVRKYDNGGRFALPPTPTTLTGSMFVDQRRSAIPKAPTSFSGRTANIQTLAGTNPDKLKQGINWAERLGSTADKLAPYASNIANAFTGPARPTMGETISSRKIVAPNFDETRNDINASEQSLGRSADQTVDGNTANSIKLGARAQTLGALNKLAATEGNARIETANKQASMDTYVDQANAQTRNQYTSDLTEFANTAKSAKLANISNAADKYVAQKNVKAQNDLDLKKTAIMSAMWDKGLTERVGKTLADATTSIFGEKKKLRTGGMINQINLVTKKLANYK